VTEWIGAAEAAQRLGIKQATLYAYVSRGVLGRRRETDGRASMFDADEIGELARKGRPRRASGGGMAEIVIESALTEITSTTQRYRGYDATDLALRCSFEDVAMLLWTGSLPAGRTGLPRGFGPADVGTAAGDGSDWQATAEALAAGRAAQAALPAGTLPLERLQVIVPALAATDQFRLHLDLPAVVQAWLVRCPVRALGTDRRALARLVRVRQLLVCPIPARPLVARPVTLQLMMDHLVLVSRGPVPPDRRWQLRPGSRRSCAQGQFGPAWCAC
jgi:predicted DNA-binding transcriptional regulator AlpA